MSGKLSLAVPEAPELSTMSCSRLRLRKLRQALQSLPPDLHCFKACGY